MKPKLRFNNFKDDYFECRLNDITEIIKDGTHGTHENVSDGIPLLSAKDIYDNIIHILEDCRKISTEDYNKIYNNYHLKENDILMTIVGTIGRTALYKNENVAFQRSVATIRVDNINNPNYVRNYLESSNVSNQLTNMTNSSAQGGIYLNSLAKIKLSLPSKEEQLKISHFLTLLDKKIHLQSKKIEDLKLFKKGLIHQMKKSSNNLVEYKISEIFKITRGVVIPKKDLSENKTNKYIYPVYSSQTSNNGILGYDEKFDFDGKYLTWTTDGANAGKVFFRNGKFRCTNVCGVLYNDNNKYVNELTAEILNYETPKYVSYVGNPKLMNNVMGDIKVFLPDIDKSDRVSNILLTINNKFLLEKNKLSKLNELKNGLMQCMFV